MTTPMTPLALIVTLFFSLFFTSSALSAGRAPWVGLDLQDRVCRGRAQGVGPLDYNAPRDRNSKLFDMVVGAHFNSKVENLVSGAKRGNGLLTDLDYTIRAVPNHSKALYSLIRYQLDDKNLHQFKYDNLPHVECYLQRAIYFVPKDYTPRMLYGIYLQKRGNLEQALSHYRDAEKINPYQRTLQYNMGLLLFKMDRMEESLVYAKRAYALKAPFPGLKRMLTKAGVWE